MRSNPYREAVKENGNILGLGAAVALSAALLNPLPLLAGLVGEAVYLLFVPDSSWYRALLSKRDAAKVEKSRRQLKDRILPALSQDMQERFARLEQTREQINAQPPEDQAWFRDVVRKLDYLLEKFLIFAAKEEQFRAYLTSVAEEVGADDRRSRRGRRDPAAGETWSQITVAEVQGYYDRELETLKTLVEKEQDEDNKGVLQKRLDILQRRHEFVAKIGKILTNLDHQLALLEDTFGLINDEIRARSPEQVVADIEEVILQADSMNEILEQMAPYEQMAARLGT